MDNRRITQILSKCETTGRHFLGVYPSDGIQVPILYPASMVINLDEASEPGSHWVAVFAKSKKEVLYFDSYGQAPNGNILGFLKKFPSVTINRFVIQSVLSDVCADYCIYFVHQCSKGVRYEDILASLAKKHNMDQFVRDFVTHLF